MGTHSAGCFVVKLNGGSKRFKAFVGVDDEVIPNSGSVEFVIVGDKKVIYKSGVLKSTDAAKEIDLDISGIKELRLMVEEADYGNYYDHADWADAYFEVTGDDPVAIELPKTKTIYPYPEAGA